VDAAFERKEEKFEHLNRKRSDAKLKKRVGGFMSSRHLHGFSIVISDNKNRNVGLLPLCIAIAAAAVVVAAAVLLQRLISTL